MSRQRSGLADGDCFGPASPSGKPFDPVGMIRDSYSENRGGSVSVNKVSAEWAQPAGVVQLTVFVVIVTHRASVHAECSVLAVDNGPSVFANTSQKVKVSGASNIL